MLRQIISDGFQIVRRRWGPAQSHQVFSMRDAGIHFSFFDERPLVCLFDPFAHTGAEALIVFDQKQRGALHQARWRNPLHAGYLLQPDFLLGGELDFHQQSLAAALWTVKPRRS